MPVAISARAGQLPRLRGQIDRREVPPAEAFGFYSDLIGAVQGTAGRRLADGMLAVGLPYEYVNHLQHAAELLAQLRGLTNGVLHEGQLRPPTEVALTRRLALYEGALQAYESSVPDVARPQLAVALDASAVRDTVERVNRLIELRRVEAIAPNVTAWWSLATEAVDTLQQAALRESAALSRRADERIADIDQRLRFTVVALVVLGVVTLGLVLSTVGRILNGLNRLLAGLETVGQRRNFATRIDDKGSDEFATISNGINKLIAIAGSALHEQETLSLTDPLTGAVNRRGFEQQLAARTTPTRAHLPPLSLLMIDVDHFKSVNDALGHASGDLVLRGLAEVLRTTLRPDDVLARFGGEEFVALLPGCPLVDGTRVAEKLRAAIEGHDFGIGRRVTASLGVAEWSREHTPQELIAAADTRLYASKAAGRNRVTPAPPSPN